VQRAGEHFDLNFSMARPARFAAQFAAEVNAIGSHCLIRDLRLSALGKDSVEWCGCFDCQCTLSTDHTAALSVVRYWTILSPLAIYRGVMVHVDPATLQGPAKGLVGDGL
jgi:hypothetical protein